MPAKKKKKRKRKKRKEAKKNATNIDTNIDTNIHEEQDEEEKEEDDEPDIAPRQWKGLTAAREVDVGDYRKLAKFTFSPEVAREFIKTTFPAFLHQRQQHDEPTDSDIITVYEGVSFTVDIWETREVETRKLRCARVFMGGLML